MPNYARTTLTITGPQEDRDRLKRLVEGETPFDLNRVIPRPASLEVPDGGRSSDALAVAEFRDTGHSNELTAMLKYSWVTEQKIQSEAQLADYLERRDAEERAVPTLAEFEKAADEDLSLLEFGRLLLNNIRQHGFPTWYKWSIFNWGTKWNTCACSLISDNEKKLMYRMSTAWSDQRLGK